MADKVAAGAARPAKEISRPTAIVLLATQGALFTAAGLALWHVSGRAIDEFVSFSLCEAAIGVIFGAALIGLAAALFRAFPKVNDHLVRLQSDTYRFLGPDLGWPAIVAISLIAGISEEAALRAGLQTLLGDHIGAAGAVAVASALFAALHLAKPLITALLFGIGIIFGTVYLLTGSLLAVMIAHVLYDVWALRYLNREMHRLGLFELPTEPATALAKSPRPG